MLVKVRKTETRTRSHDTSQKIEKLPLQRKPLFKVRSLNAWCGAFIRIRGQSLEQQILANSR
jgi:hypothetical protein